MGLYRKFVSQTRKPAGFLGKVMINGMNSGHAKMAAWGLAHINSIHPGNIVELGCGGGRNVAALLKNTRTRRLQVSTILRFRCRLQRISTKPRSPPADAKFRRVTFPHLI